MIQFNKVKSICVVEKRYNSRFHACHHPPTLFTCPPTNSIVPQKCKLRGRVQLDK